VKCGVKLYHFLQTVINNENALKMEI